VDLDEEDPKPNELPAVDEEEDEEKVQKPQAKQEGMETRAMKERRIREEEEKKALMKTRKLTREMAAEENFKRRMTRSMSQAHVAIENEIGEENYRVYLTETEPNEPKTFKQAIESKEAVQWKESMKSEVINFISRGSWRISLEREEIGDRSQLRFVAEWWSTEFSSLGDLVSLPNFW